MSTYLENGEQCRHNVAGHGVFTLKSVFKDFCFMVGFGGRWKHFSTDCSVL